MTITPLKSYGFNYKYNGKEYAFDVLANSIEEAECRVAAMSNATIFGELTESPNVELTGAARPYAQRPC